MPKNEIEKSDEKKQQQEKDYIQKVLADKAEPTCSNCGKHLYKPPQCRCGGGGGGGGGGSGDANEKADKSGGQPSASTAGSVDMKSEAPTAQEINSEEESSLLNDINFNPEVISELLSKKPYPLLTIENDRESGTLTIKLQCDPNSLSKEHSNELKKYMNAILKALEEFKNTHGISAECKTIKQDKDGNISFLRITLPTPGLYDDFIKDLAKKNLLPRQAIEQKSKEKVYQEGVNHFATPKSKVAHSQNSDMKSKKKDHESIENQNSSHLETKHASIRPKTPTDINLKPKGWK